MIKNSSLLPLESHLKKTINSEIAPPQRRMGFPIATTPLKNWN
tara:strand:- start:624 stop:752 length:129 start_codon:yes stop_codon:yes gene_type:complete